MRQGEDGLKVLRQGAYSSACTKVSQMQANLLFWRETTISQFLHHGVRYMLPTREVAIVLAIH